MAELDYWEQVTRIFEETLRREPGERSAFLEEQCGDNAQLRAEVESLVLHHQQAPAGFLPSERKADGTVTRPRSQQPAASDDPLREVGAEGSMPRVHVPDYELKHRIGRGGFGEVWLGRNHHDHRFYAVKLIHSYAEIELEGIRQYKQRVEDHPNLVPILHVGESGSVYYYVMPLAENASGSSPLIDPSVYRPLTLRTHLDRRGQLDIDEALRITDDLLSALEHLHDRGGTHGDVKPANILRQNGVWRLGDHGLVSSSSQRTVKGYTPPYSPPEGAGSLSADLYAVGVVLFELLSGADPARHRDLGGGHLDILADDQRGERLRAVILRAVCADPQKRFVSAQNMRTALQAVSNHSDAPVPTWKRPVAVTLGLLLLTAGLLVPSAVWLRSQLSQPELDPPPRQTHVRIALDWVGEKPGVKDAFEVTLYSNRQGLFYVFRIEPDGRAAAFRPSDAGIEEGTCESHPVQRQEDSLKVALPGHYIAGDPPGPYWLVAVLTDGPLDAICREFEERLILDSRVAFKASRASPWPETEETAEIRDRVRSVIDASPNKNSILGFDIYPYSVVAD